MSLGAEAVRLSGRHWALGAASPGRQDIYYRRVHSNRLLFGKLPSAREFRAVVVGLLRGRAKWGRAHAGEHRGNVRRTGLAPPTGAQGRRCVIRAVTLVTLPGVLACRQL